MATKSVRGFSLIELVIVIAVIAILAALLAPTILGQAERARLSRAHSDVAELGKVVARIRTDTGSSSAQCLTSIYQHPLATGNAPADCGGGTHAPNCSTVSPGYVCWGGPYTVSVTNDPWNNAYTASEDTTTYAVTITSAGPDGTFGGTDDITFVQ
jgi:general secretion pathway protein G